MYPQEARYRAVRVMIFVFALSFLLSATMLLMATLNPELIQEGFGSIISKHERLVRTMMEEFDTLTPLGMLIGISLALPSLIYVFGFYLVWTVSAILEPFRLFHRFLTVDNRRFIEDALRIMLVRWCYVAASTVVAVMGVVGTGPLLESNLPASLKGVIILWEIWLPIWIPFYLMRTPQLSMAIEWTTAGFMSLFNFGEVTI